jgi:hypothetical protein
MKFTVLFERTRRSSMNRSWIRVLSVVALLTPAFAQAGTLKQAQSAVAYRLKQMTSVKGNDLFHVYKRSILAKNITVKGNLNGSTGIDHGPTLSFSTEVRRPTTDRGGAKTTELLKVNGKYITNSFIGPYLKLTSVKLLQAP